MDRKLTERSDSMPASRDAREPVVATGTESLTSNAPRVAEASGAAESAGAWPGVPGEASTSSSCTPSNRARKTGW